MFEEKPPCDNSQKLKTQREAMGLSLEDVFKKIRIRSSYLDAMEKGEFNLLPDAVYTKNFIKIYAKFLRVDEDPILSDYNDYLNSQKEELAHWRRNLRNHNPFLHPLPIKKSIWELFLY